MITQKLNRETHSFHLNADTAIQRERHSTTARAVKYPNMVKIEQNPGYSARLRVVISRPVAKPAYYLTHNAGNFAFLFGSDFSFHRSKFDQSLSVGMQKNKNKRKKSRLLQRCRREIGITKLKPLYLLNAFYEQNQCIHILAIYKCY